MYLFTEETNDSETVQDNTPIDVAKYNPIKSDYHPLNDAGWKRGENVPYMALARTLEQVNLNKLLV